MNPLAENLPERGSRTNGMLAPTTGAARSVHARALADLGIKLVPIPPGQKGPTAKNWPSRAINDPGAAAAYWQQNPHDNMGAVLGPSHVVSLDVDAPEHARKALADAGYDLDAILAHGVAIIGNPAKAKSFFRAPVGEMLPTHKWSWPPDPSSAPDKDGRRKRLMILELRAGDGLQDVLPPSIHPETRLPYRFVEGRDPWTLGGFPEMPQELLRLWREWPQMADTFAAACPWKALEEGDLREGSRRLLGGGQWADVRREILHRLPLRGVLQRMGVPDGKMKFSCPIHPPDTNPSAWTWKAQDGAELMICAHGKNGCSVGVETKNGHLMLDALSLEAFRRELSPGKATSVLAHELSIPLPGRNGDPERRRPEAEATPAPAGEPNKKPAIRIATVDALDLIAHPPPAPLSLVDTPGLIDAGEIGIDAGDPGSGKSLFLVNFAAAVAAGRDFFHLRRDSRDPVPALLLLAEYNRYRAWQRLAGVVKHFEIPRGMLHVWTREDAPGFIDLTEGEVLDTAHVLADFVRREGVQLVAVDSVSEVHTQDENDRLGMGLLVRAFRIVADARASVQGIHHNRKPPSGARRSIGDPSMADVRGSTALPAGLASILSFRRESPEDADGLAFVAAWVKANYAEPNPRAFRFRLDDPASGVITSMEPANLGGRSKGLDNDTILKSMHDLGGERLEVKAIAEKTRASERTIRDRLNEMLAKGRLPTPEPGERKAKLWSLPDTYEVPET